MRSLLGLRRLVCRSSLLPNCAAIELGLLLARLEPPVAELGRSVDEFQVDDLHRHTAHLRKEGLPQGQDTATWPHGLSLDHHPILGHFAIVRESAHGRDGLLREIHFCHRTMGVVLDRFANTVDLLVDLRAVVVAVLARARNLKRNTRRVPRADATNLPETTVGFPRQPRDAPSRNDTVVPMTPRGANEVD